MRFQSKFLCFRWTFRFLNCWVRSWHRNADWPDMRENVLGNGEISIFKMFSMRIFSLDFSQQLRSRQILVKQKSVKIKPHQLRFWSWKIDSPTNKIYANNIRLSRYSKLTFSVTTGLTFSINFSIGNVKSIEEYQCAFSNSKLLFVLSDFSNSVHAKKCEDLC